MTFVSALMVEGSAGPVLRATAEQSATVNERIKRNGVVLEDC